MAKIRLEKFNGQYIITVLVADTDEVVIDNVHRPTHVYAPASIIAKGESEVIIIKGENNDSGRKKR